MHFEGFELEVLKDYVEIWRPILLNRRKVEISSRGKVGSVQGDKTGSCDQAGKTDSRTAASEQEEDTTDNSENKTGEGETEETTEDIEYDYGIPEDDKVLEIEIANSFNHMIQQRYINHIY